MEFLLVDVTILNPQELVVLIVAVGGLVPLAMYYHKTSRWFVLAYGFLLVGAITTNVENLLWHDTFNFIEHAIGNMGAGIAFAIGAYVHRQKITGSSGEIGDKER